MEDRLAIREDAKMHPIEQLAVQVETTRIHSMNKENERRRSS